MYPDAIFYPQKSSLKHLALNQEVVLLKGTYFLHICIHTGLWSQLQFQSAFHSGYFYPSVLFIASQKDLQDVLSWLCQDLLEDPTQQIVNGSFFFFVFIFCCITTGNSDRMNLLVVPIGLLVFPFKIGHI